MNVNNKFLKLISVGALAFIVCACGSTDPDVKAASDLVGRVVPSLNSHVKFEKVVQTDSVDRFTLRQEGDKVVIGGNNAGSMAMGLNYYLKNYCLTEVSWYSNDPVELPDTCPTVEGTITVDAKVPYRFFLNYCTSGYSMPWWNWDDWEHFIDWMALNGINLPLATTGQEAVWYNVWRQMGLTDEEIRSYFTGPAHLPWHRMCNVDGWQGPLPEKWLENESELQKKIVARERELSMKPVLPGFAGHVPEALKRLYPEALTTTVSEWGGFPNEYRCTYLSPADSLFAYIQKMYLDEQTRMYGTDHIYGIDPFNEVDPPTWDADSLAMMSGNIFKSVTDVDPDAVWLQMAWILYADPEHWTTDRAKAYIQGVPEGRMMLLDYYCESVEEWKLFDSFYGQPYIWCYLGNFGGNSFIASPFLDVDRRINDVYENGGSNLVGIGSTLEGLDVNPYIYEYVLDRAWNMPTEGKEAIYSIIDRRVGREDKFAREGWRVLVDSVMISPALCGQGPLVNARPSMTGFSWWTTKPNIDYANMWLDRAWGWMLSAENTGRYTQLFDCVNIGRQVLSNHFMVLRDEFAQAYDRKDVDMLVTKANEMSELLDDLTALLNTCHGTRMSKWIADARAKGTTADEQDYYERNARTIVSIWGPSKELNDYANRQWAELNGTYYAPRWNMFTNMVIDAVREGREFDADEFYDKCREFENAWIEPRALQIETTPATDDMMVVRDMYNKYSSKIFNHHASRQGTSTPSLHHW